MRLELTNTGFAIQRLSHLATRANWNGRRDSNSRDEFGRLACFQLHHFREESLPQRGTKNTETIFVFLRPFLRLKNLVGEDRVELSPRVPRTRMRTLHHTPKLKLVRQVRLELTLPCLRGRCLDPIWLLTHGGTERTRTVISLIDNQVPHPSATVPLREIWVGRRELNPHAPQSQCGALRIELRPTCAGDK